MFRKNVAGQFIHVQGVDSATGGIKSAVTWTVRRCIDGTFAAATGTATEDGTTGWYKFALSQADTNGNNIGFNFTGTGAIPQTVNIVTTAADPTDAVRLGLTGLANATPGATGGLFIAGTNAATTITTGLTTTFTGNLSGSVASVTGLTASDVGAIKTKTDFLPSATAGAAGGVFIAGTNAATTITTGLTTTFTGNLTGSVASVTGLTASDVGTIKTKTDFLPSATAGAAGGVFIAGSNAATSITTALTANITGNLSGSAGSVTGNVGGNVVGSVASVTAGVTVTTNNDKTGYGLSSAAVQAVWDALTTALTTAGSIGKKLADWTIGTAQTGDSFARLGAPAGASVSADVAAVKADTAAVKTQTDKLTFTVANQVDANIQSINDTAIVGNGASPKFGV